MHILYGVASINKCRNILQEIFSIVPFCNPWDRTFLPILIPDLDRSEHVSEGSQEESLWNYAVLSQWELYLCRHSFAVKSTIIVQFSGPGNKKELLFLQLRFSTNIALRPSRKYLYIFTQNRRKSFTVRNRKPTAMPWGLLWPHVATSNKVAWQSHIFHTTQKNIQKSMKHRRVLTLNIFQVGICLFSPVALLQPLVPA